MATSSDVQLVVQVVDKATAQLGVINKTIVETGKVSDEAHKKMAEGSKRSFEGLVSLNQGLELAKKGFEAIKFAIEVPLHLFEEMFEVSEKLVRKYDEQFLAETKLTQAAKSSGNASSENVKQFKELADQLEKTTRFQADTIVSGQAMALAMGASSRIIPQVTQAALDLASATGTDATTGFERLIQAVETGSLRTFGRAHIDFQKTGVAVLDFATAAELAESKFRGLSQEVAKGGAGQLITVENAFDKIEKSLGKIIATSPQFQGFLKTVTDLFGEIQTFIDEHGAELGNLFGATFAASVDVALKALDLFIGALKLAGSLIFAMLDALSHVPGLGVESPFADINKQIETLSKQRASIGGIMEIPISPEAARKVDELTEKINALIEKKKELAKDPFGGTGLGASLDVARTAASKLADEIEKNPLFTATGFSDRWKKNTADAATAIDDMKNHVDTFSESSKNHFQDVISQLNEMEKATEKYGGGVEFLSKIIEGTDAKGGDLFEATGRALQLLLRQGDINEEQFGALVHTMKEGFSEATHEIDKADEALKKMNSDARAGGGAGVNVGVPASGGTSTPGVSSSSGGAAAQAGGAAALEAAARAMSEAVVAAAGKLEAAAGNFDEPIKGLTDVGAALALETKAGTDAATAISGAADLLNQSGAVLIAAGVFIGASAKDSANDLITAASDLVTASGFLDKSFRQGSFPRLGFGGVPTGQTLATVGDRPEVILPLDDRGLAFARSLLSGKTGGGGDTVNVHINVDRMDLSDESMNDLARIVERRLADRVLESVRRS